MEKSEKENPLFTDPGHATPDEIMIVILMRQWVLASQKYVVQHQRILKIVLQVKETVNPKIKNIFLSC